MEAWGSLWLLPIGLQGAVMAVDELHFHRGRGLTRREWLGHAADSAGLLACLALPVFLRPTPALLGLYAILAAGSCALVTKDEFIHQRACSGGEHWCHAVLFLLHPLVLVASAWLWLCWREPGACLPLAALAGIPAPAAGAAAWMVRGEAAAVAACLGLQVALGGRR